MNNTLVLGVLLALIVGGIGGFTVAHVGKDGKRWDNRSYDHKREIPAGNTMRDGSNMNEHGMHADMMVGSEREFIEHMIPHHEEAVMTAKEVLARGGTTPEVRALAEAIITAQEKEIADMKTWYAAWYGSPYIATGTYRPMMRDLTALSGTELDKVFLEDMIHHHMGAIMMARSVERSIEHAEMRTLTENIVRTQSEEIATMQRLLADF